MKNQSGNLSRNLSFLRERNQYSQEAVAEKIGVSRQAVARWESGETAPDIANCDALARLYDVTVDDLLHFDGESALGIPPKGKHLFGTVTIGERGQLVLPKKARDVFHIQPGDTLVVLGDEAPERAGIALVPSSTFLNAVGFMENALRQKEADAQ